MTENVWQLEEGEVRKPGIVHVVMLALFTGIGIVVGTFGSLAIPIGFVFCILAWSGCAEYWIYLVWVVGSHRIWIVPDDFKLVIRFCSASSIICLSSWKPPSRFGCGLGIPKV